MSARGAKITPSVCDCNLMPGFVAGCGFPLRFPAFARLPRAGGNGNNRADLKQSLRDLSRPSFMDRLLWTGSYGQDVLYAARGQEARSRPVCGRGHAYRDVGGRPRLEQAVEVVDGVGNRPSRTPVAARRKPESDHFVIPAKAGIQWFVLSIPACRQAGMTTGMTTERGYPAKPAIHSPLGLPLLDSSFRWNDGGGMSSFMGRMSCMRREGRTPVAALYAARGHAYRTYAYRT